MKKNIDPPVYKYLFGPVPSRRFGLSLGVDMVPFKTCTLNCVFCELGRTTRLTDARREYAPLADILGELDHWFSAGGKADFVTVAGSGEPTLHTGFGEVLKFVRRAGKGRKSALLTNGTLLRDPAVRAAAIEADVVKATLSAWDQASFDRLHRPHPRITFAGLIEGLESFAAGRKHELWLEVFFVPGINDTPGQARRVAKLAARLRPDKIQINTAVRPTAEPGVAPVAAGKLADLAALFTPAAEVAASPAKRGAKPAAALDVKAVILMLRRRPCSARDIAGLFGIDEARAEPMLKELEAQGVLTSEKRRHGKFYTAKKRLARFGTP